jgi:hypothetical protein
MMVTFEVDSCIYVVKSVKVTFEVDSCTICIAKSVKVFLKVKVAFRGKREIILHHNHTDKSPILRLVPSTIIIDFFLKTTQLASLETGKE